MELIHMAKRTSLVLSGRIALLSTISLSSIARATEYESVVAHQHVSSHVILPAGNQPVLLSSGIEAPN